MFVLKNCMEKHNSIELFLERNEYMNVKIHNPRQFQKEPRKIEFLSINGTADKEI